MWNFVGIQNGTTTLVGGGMDTQRGQQRQHGGTLNDGMDKQRGNFNIRITFFKFKPDMGHVLLLIIEIKQSSNKLYLISSSSYLSRYMLRGSLTL